ncbi:RND family efflux transporter, MFP subunit [Bernardetia litoralis DSM 6794]|uniref:RND family efflux transporter, MFP subunit n=1 Tax=Bernardetia litoralis (strain ATCC 23117 / DSM 6794 / NBRC 15988 / NCIMB 1366 / Fx l1 / Sio-4) TaxID=880071 RepID=I4AGE3_BERLS|nr:efflux RND transporter periplasmic adaptor subunit [Bernardetia litoralis]AFM03028.1 RND family efflux transporter, MFP subunit [Bernardetia litoralis DSM 6794]
MKKYTTPIIAITVTAAIAVWIFFTLKTNKETINENAALTEEVIKSIPVHIVKVEEIKIDENINLTGTFEAEKELGIIAEGQGRITSLPIKEGQQVSKNQAVAKIDDTSIQAQLNSIRATVAKAKKDVERYERLTKAGAISQQQYEEVKLNYQSTQANLTNVEQQLNYSTARSPMAGIIKEIKVEEGSFASAGMLIATVVDIDKLKMVVKADEQEVIKIQKGQSVEITTEVYPNTIFEGKVTLISVQADAGRKYEVEIELPNPKKMPLKPGMYGTVKINSMDKNATENKAKLYVARKTIVGSVQSPKVYVVNKDGKTVSYKTVQIGEAVGDKVEILEGLDKGDVVVVSGQINLSDGKEVSIINQNNLTIDTKPITSK